MHILTGWTGKILRIDLGRKTTDTLFLDKDIYRTWIGGRGLAGYVLRPHVILDWDHPDMPVIFMTGPLVGTISPTSGRGTLMSRSPLTGTVGDASFGGALATRLKQAGWDGVVITGQSGGLVGVEIDDDQVRIVDAEGLRALGTSEVFRRLGKKPETSVACIGPAGENGSLLSCVVVDQHHAAGRCGLGASLGAKQVKYLSVRGSGKVRVADEAALQAAREDIVRLTMASPALMGQQGFACFGTGALFDLMDARRMMPTDNFRATWFEPAEKLNAYAYKMRYQPESHGCKGCHIQCKKVRRAGEGKSAWFESMPGFETMSHFTALIENADMELVMQAHARLGDLGLDPIGSGATLACLKEVDGLGPLTEALVLSGIEEMASGPVGLGAGSRRYAAARGRAGASMSVKGLELSAYDPRGAYGTALAYATSTRGGCPLRAYPISHEILRKPVATDRFSFSGKARMVKIAEDTHAVVDSLTACKFIFFAAGLEEYARVYAAVTGEKTTCQDLLQVGERIYYHDRVMNALNGFGAAADDLPMRFFVEAGSSGEGVMVAPLSREAFLEARARYYRIRGLTENGQPIAEKAETLGVTL